MQKQRDARQRALVALLHSMRSRTALARSAFVNGAVAGVAPARAKERRMQLAAQLPAVIDALVAEIASESAQQERRIAVLRRSDIAREEHATIAADMGLSRSQFYRDLHDAREALGHALDERVARSAQPQFSAGAGDARFIAIDALRSGGRFDHARDMASKMARSADATEAVRALCVRAEVELELGAFAAAAATVESARRIATSLPAPRLRASLEARCDLIACEAAHGCGRPWSETRRQSAIDRWRREYRAGDRERGLVVARALTEEATLRFEQADATAASRAIEEARSVARDAAIDDARLIVDIEVRASGIHALNAESVGQALGEAQAVVEGAGRSGDVRALRAGTQMVAAHFLTLDRLDEARRCALEALHLIELFGSRLDRVVALSNLARVDLHRRNGAQALRWIRQARAIPCDAFSIAQALAISEVEALVLLERPAQALALARALKPRVGDWSRLTGRLKHAEALTLEALGRRGEAREGSAAAVAHARAEGSPLLQIRTLELDVRLSNSAASRKRLREVRAALIA